MQQLGKVYLVGAGPGNPGLLTLRALQCLEQADLILYDGLVNPLVLRQISAQVERTCRSHGPDGRVLRQDEINRRLIEASQNGKTVVRLKGGDPFIFGRGSEEAAALADAGIPFEVVPGITAATAASEYAGISLTHRELASAVAFVTGHEDPAKDETSIDYANLAAFSGTLVFYMGLHRLETIVDSLLREGKDPNTPACVIGRATTPLQQTVCSPLMTLPAEVRGADIWPPSLIVIGQCVHMREKIAWFEKRPLFGKQIGITRPVAQAGPAITKALELGAQPVLLPTIEILPPADWSAIDVTLSRLSEFDWLIFTSANGVWGLLNRLWGTGGDLRSLSSVRLAVIGPGTATALASYHLKPDIVPDSYRAEVLAEALKPLVSDKRVLWARASRGRDILPRELENSGASVEQLVVYRNEDIESLPASELERIERGELNWIGLSSPSIARSLNKLLTPRARIQIGKTVQLVSISPVTSAAAAEVGLPIAVEAQQNTWDGIFEAVIAAETSGF